MKKLLISIIPSPQLTPGEKVVSKKKIELWKDDSGKILNKIFSKITKRSEKTKIINKPYP